MYKYRVQIEKTDHCQVDIESETELTATDLFILVKQAGNREFGTTDETTIINVESNVMVDVKGLGG